MIGHWTVSSTIVTEPNLCGALVLAYWHVAGRLPLSIFGVIALWTLVLIVVGLTVIELYSHLKRVWEQQPQ